MAPNKRRETIKMRLKNFLAIATLISLACTSCTSDVYLGNPEDISQEVAISFDGGTGKSTRAMQGGKDAADSLGNNFVVYGWKTMPTDPVSTLTVFDHYNVNYTAGSAHSTLSNSAGWEYAGQAPNVLNTYLYASPETQDIKYWDFSATQYDFVAFSAGGATQQAVTGAPGQAGYPGTPESGKLIVTPVDRGNPTTQAYTITGAPADLTKVYIADRVTAQQTPVTSIPNRLVTYRDAIQFAFRPLAAKVRIGLYETIPGYSVKDVKFYTDDQSGTVPAAAPALFANGNTIPDGVGAIRVSFPETNSAQETYNKAKLDYSSTALSSTLTIGTKLNAEAAKEDQENGGNIFLGRTSSTASMSADQKVIPTPASVLTLKVDFTLVSIDYNETITVHGATATIPPQYTNWQPNYAYTYLFKISDAVSNSFGQVLYPITFDALETVADNGTQQTIITVSYPSIATYAKGVLGTDYYVGDNIYVSVTNGTAKLLSGENAKLYTAQAISPLEERDITEKNLMDKVQGITLTPASGLTFENHIEGADSPTGDRVDPVSGSNFAKFTPATGGIYVFEYIEQTPEYYKTLQEYNDANPDAQHDQAWWDSFSATADEKIKVPAGSKYYKVIRVGGTRS